MTPIRIKGHLAKFPSEYYRGETNGLWTLVSLKRRSLEWDATAHAQWRELLLHTCHRYSLAVPAYCLMPDHLHLVFCGLTDCSDQRIAAQFLRTHLEGDWEHQWHDRMLRRRTGPGGVESACAYVMNNPVKAALVPQGEDWPWSGTLIPGYPTLSCFRADFWDVWARLREKDPSL